MLAFGGNIALDDLGVGFLGDASNYAIGGFLAILIAAFIGAMVVMGIITFFSAIVRSHTVLLIIGLTVGYLASSAISLLNFFSTAEGVKSYMVWGMGSFGNVSSQQVMFFIQLALIALAASLLLVKPLNAMLLGERYARSGFQHQASAHRSAHHHRSSYGLWLLPSAVPSPSSAWQRRISPASSSARRIIAVCSAPVTMLMGAAATLLCNLFCTLPSDGGIIPLNAVTPLFGAPVIIYVLVKKRI